MYWLFHYFLTRSSLYSRQAKDASFLGQSPTKVPQEQILLHLSSPSNWFEMDSSEAGLDRIEAQRSTDVSHDQQKVSYFPVNLMKTGARTLFSLCFSQSKGAGTMPLPTGDTKSVPDFLTNLRLLDLYNIPGQYVAMTLEMYCAMQAGNREFLEMMKTYETPLACFKNDKGDTILHLAAASGHLELVKSLVSVCPSLLLELNWKDQLSLHLAARAGHSSVVEALIASIAYFQAKLYKEDSKMPNLYVLKDKNGDTALHLTLKDLYEKKERLHSKAVSFSDVLMKIAASLVKANKCASFLANNNEISPLYMAVKVGNVSLVDAMLSIPGDNIQCRTSNLASQLEGRKSLVHAAIKAKNIDVLDLIFSVDPSLVNELDEEGRTCLSYAASVGYEKGVCYLLDRSIKAIFVSDADGYFPIHMAAKYGHVNVLKAILKSCPDALELPGKHDQNILHVASNNGRLKAVKFILKVYKDGNMKKSVNEQDADGNTLLHLACKNAHAKVVSMLTWDDRVDLNTVNSSGFTALDILVGNMVTSCGFRELLTWAPLRSAGAQKSDKRKLPLLGVDGAYKDDVSTFMLVSTLVATMTFTAGFALPGGYNGSVPNLGMAALAKKRAFQVFLVFDTLAMYSSLLTTVTLIWTQLSDHSIITKAFKLALPLLVLSLTFMSIAFMAGTYAAISHIPLLSYFLLGIGLIFLGVSLMIMIPYVSPKYCTNPFLRYIFYIPYILLVWAAGDNRNNG